jgi:signal transduction histidine kinase
MFHTVSDVIVWSASLLVVCGIIEKIIQKNTLAIPYMVIIMFPCIGMLNYFLNVMGIINIRFLYPNSIAVGVLIEAVFLTMLLAFRYNLLQKEKSTLLLNQNKLMLELSQAQENEQMRIAADLHDGLGSFLTALRLMVNKNLHHFTGKGNNEITDVLNTIQAHIDKAIANVRIISHNLMPNDFDELPFSEIIKNHLENVISTTQLYVEYSLDEKINALPRNIQIELYRILAEMLNNALIHSQSKHITIQFIIHHSIVQLMVEDDGIGIDKEKQVKGIGLRNIHARVENLKGKLNIDSSEKGTILIVEIPTP